MKKYSKFILFLLVASLALSACKVATVTPPVDEPTAVVEETPTDEGTEPTENLTPQPTIDTRLTDDDGSMVCTIVPPLFSELTAERKPNWLSFRQ